jgi:hypothetical protein
MPDLNGLIKAGEHLLSVLRDADEWLAEKGEKPTSEPVRDEQALTCFAQGHNEVCGLRRGHEGPHSWQRPTRPDPEGQPGPAGAWASTTPGKIAFPRSRWQAFSTEELRFLHGRLQGDEPAITAMRNQVANVLDERGWRPRG